MATGMPGPADILVAALPNQGQGEFEDLSLDLQEYPSVELMKKNKMVITGTGLKRRISFTHQGTARHVDMFEPDAHGFSDVLKTVTQELRITNAYYSFGEIEMKEAGTNPEALTNIVKVREQGMNASLLELQEEDIWSFGPATSADTKTPMGIPYSILKDQGAVTSATYGIEYGAPSGHASGRFGQINAKHGNWVEMMSAWTRADALYRLKRMAYKTHFKRQIPALPSTSAAVPKRGIYMNWEARNALETLGEESGENKTKELAWWNGAFLFHGVECTNIPQLDSDSSNPIYMIDHGTFFYVEMEGFGMKRTIKPMYPDHLSATVYKDIVWNTFCIALRRNGVMYTV